MALYSECPISKNALFQTDFWRFFPLGERVILLHFDFQSLYPSAVLNSKTLRTPFYSVLFFDIDFKSTFYVLVCNGVNLKKYHSMIHEEEYHLKSDSDIKKAPHNLA